MNLSPLEPLIKDLVVLIEAEGEATDDLRDAKASFDAATARLETIRAARGKMESAYHTAASRIVLERALGRLGEAD